MLILITGITCTIQYGWCWTNHEYYVIKKIFSSKFHFKETKNKLYISYIRFIVIYFWETWSTSKEDEYKLLNFERKVVRIIYAPIYNTKTKQYKRKRNADIERIFIGPNIQKCLVTKRLEWGGHIWRDKYDEIIINR